MHEIVHFRDLGNIEYGEAWAFQENLLKEQIDLDNDKVLHDRQVQQWKNQLVHVEMPVRRLDPDLKY